MSFLSLSLPLPFNNIIIIYSIFIIPSPSSPSPSPSLSRSHHPLPPSTTHARQDKERKRKRKTKKKRTMLAIPPTILPIPTSWVSAACISSSLLFLIYFASLVIYRLYWSPLAKIPGPKLAAATFWYEFYYDVIRRGRYTWKIGELHEEYGMFIRRFFIWMEESVRGEGGRVLFWGGLFC